VGGLEEVDRPLARPVREACAATDWERHGVVDVVTYAPAMSLGFEGDRQRVEVCRYRGRAPPLSVYENGEHGFRVSRVTRPLWERLR
jgi:hypothetical protein